MGIKVYYEDQFGYEDYPLGTEFSVVGDVLFVRDENGVSVTSWAPRTWSRVEVYHGESDAPRPKGDDCCAGPCQTCEPAPPLTKTQAASFLLRHIADSLEDED